MALINMKVAGKEEMGRIQASQKMIGKEEGKEQVGSSTAATSRLKHRALSPGRT